MTAKEAVRAFRLVQDDGKDTAYITNALVTAFDITQMEYCTVCSARVDVLFGQNASYWCPQCAQSVDDVRISKLATLKIFPDTKSEPDSQLDLVQDGMRTVAFGTAAQALENMNSQLSIVDRVVRVRMSVKRIAEGAEAFIHAC